jgi:hypothetical protein
MVARWAKVEHCCELIMGPSQTASWAVQKLAVGGVPGRYAIPLPRSFDTPDGVF